VYLFFQNTFVSDSAEIVAVVIAYELGKSISEKLDKGIVATATITPGSKQRKQYVVYF